MISLYYGQPIQHLSHYRKIIGKIATENQLNEDSVSIRPVYIVDFKKQITSHEEEKLKKYLENNEDLSTQIDNDKSAAYYVIPRLGTTSPWSSKATDIAKICGLGFLEKVELGLVWKFETQIDKKVIGTYIYDPLTQDIVDNEAIVKQLFYHAEPKPLVVVDILNDGISALHSFDQNMQLAISEEEKNYLYHSYANLRKNPTDAELMMFSQVNSEHCRHKIFNAHWTLDGKNIDIDSPQKSLFSMIRFTHQSNPQNTLVAYKDNSSVIKGHTSNRSMLNEDNVYISEHEPIHILMKVETHNHPTAISPFPGAATGSGGEIRDEGATGRGSKPKAGLTGYSVSHLHLQDGLQDWEFDASRPKNICSALQIMLEAPIGGASFNNEFGRPNLLGYFRSFEQKASFDDDANARWGYHKPIMIAGGLGNIRQQHVDKNDIPVGAKLVVLGGPAMLIGLGGGAASSLGSGQSNEDLDFASVQRGNPEMQRRCQEVIDRCWAMGEDNPIVSIHDVGAGGISNALPEIINDVGLGGIIELRKVLNEDVSMSPMEIWCNEAQERYVLAIEPKDIERFEKICHRERCLYCVVGETTKEQHLLVNESLLSFKAQSNQPIDVPMDLLFGNPPKMHRVAEHHDFEKDEGFTEKDKNDHDFIAQSVARVLQHPTVADKTFLITIGDRSVTGLVVRDQMVGPWQVPVADVAVTLSGFDDDFGEAMAMGERTPLAIHNGPASARMAVAEAITNIAAARIENISDIKLSANWMAAAGQIGQDAILYDTVKAIGMDFCPALGISIPVGKDSMSMRSQWQDDSQKNNTVMSPVSLIISAFSPVQNVSKTLTPWMKNIENSLLLIDLGQNKNRLGASCLEQVYAKNSAQCADIEDTNLLKNFFNCIQALNKDGLIEAYHDRSDGGLIVTLLEMAFASRAGLNINLKHQTSSPLEIMFNEEVGVVLQIEQSKLADVLQIIEEFDLDSITHQIGEADFDNQDDIIIKINDNFIYQQNRIDLHKLWSKTSWQMQRLRDNPVCADEEFQRLDDKQDSGLNAKLNFDIKSIQHPYISKNLSPKVAILREQGTNGHFEMANAFSKAGFKSVDVHMSDLIENRVRLNEFEGFAACGGFSYGDVLGAGKGWANSILFNDSLNKQFDDFFHDQSKFVLGVCNGCQMLSVLKDIIPGAENWPTFERNFSEQYEARQVLVKVKQNNSLFFKDMQDSIIPIVVGHGEGRAHYQKNNVDDSQIVMQYIDNKGDISSKYPYNPNGSTEAVSGLTNQDGRITIMMPHPERVIRSANFSYLPEQWKDELYSPWLKLFLNAREWVA